MYNEIELTEIGLDEEIAYRNQMFRQVECDFISDEARATIRGELAITEGFIRSLEIRLEHLYDKA